MNNENFYYLRKIKENDDIALYKHSFYNRFYRSSFPVPDYKSFRLYKAKRLSTILKHRKALYDYCGEWFDVYDQNNTKIASEIIEKYIELDRRVRNF